MQASIDSSRETFSSQFSDHFVVSQGNAGKCLGKELAMRCAPEL